VRDELLARGHHQHCWIVSLTGDDDEIRLTGYE
jgi:hypothetical protein